MLPHGKNTKYILVYSKQRKRKTSASRDNMDEHWKHNVDWRKQLPGDTTIWKHFL